MDAALDARDDMTALLSSVTVHKMKAALDADGNIVGCMGTWW